MKIRRWVIGALVAIGLVVYGLKVAEDYNYRSQVKDAAAAVTLKGAQKIIEAAKYKSCDAGWSVEALSTEIKEDGETVYATVILNNKLDRPVKIKYHVVVERVGDKLYSSAQTANSLEILQEVLKVQDEFCGGVK